MNVSRSSILLALAAAVLVVLLFVGLGSIYTVNEREVAVVLEFGEPVASRTEPGLYYKIPFVQEVRRLPATLQYYRTGEADKLEDLPTADGKKIEVSAYAIWRITDPMQFVRVLRTVENAEDRIIRARVRSEIRNVITQYDLAEAVRSTNRELTYSFGATDESGDADEIEAAVPLGEVSDISLGRRELVDQIRRQVIARLNAGDDGLKRGVELVDVGISNIEFVPSVQAAAFLRFRTQLESYAAGYRNAGEQRKQEILNATNAEVEKILGEGEQRSKEIRGEVDARNIREFAAAINETGDFYNFQKTLEVYQSALGGGTKLILTTDSDLLGLLKALPPADPAPDTPGTETTGTETTGTGVAAAE